MKYGMTGRQNLNKVKLTYLCIHLTSCSVGMKLLKLLETFKDSKDCFVCIFSDIELVLFDSKFIFSSLTLPVAFSLNTFWFRKVLA